MITRITISTTIALLVFGGHAALAQEESKDGVVLGLDVGDGLHYSWNDVEDASTYHIHGAIDYWPLPLCPRSRDIDNELVTFDEELPAGATSFDAPGPPRERMTFKSFTFMIEALDAAGGVIARDGFTSQSDPFCSPPELAAAGTGPGLAGRDALPLISAALAAFGAIAIAGALLSRRRRAP